jgi:hypothetical protein
MAKKARRKSSATSTRDEVIAKLLPGWEIVRHPSKVDSVLASSSADAVSKSLNDLKSRRFGTAPGVADTAAPPRKSKADTVVVRSEGQEKTVTLVNGKISSVQG